MLIRTLFAIIIFGLLLFSYLNAQIDLMRLRLEVPKLAEEVKELQEDNTRLSYLIRQFESPDNLLRLARKPEFSSLKQPAQTDIIEIYPNRLHYADK